MQQRTGRASVYLGSFSDRGVGEKVDNAASAIRRAITGFFMLLRVIFCFIGACGHPSSFWTKAVSPLNSVPSPNDFENASFFLVNSHTKLSDSVYLSLVFRDLSHSVSN